MADVIRVDWFSDSWLGGVVRLTAEERGVYDTIINLIYQTNGPLEDDDKALSHACNCGRAAYRRAKATLIKQNKISVCDGLISQSKCALELDRARARIKAYEEREIRKKLQKNEKKTNKKQEKSMQKNEQKQENHAVSINRANSQQAVSPPLTGEANKPVTRAFENSSPASSSGAPARESGGGLSDDARGVLREIGRQATLRPNVNLRDMDLVKSAVQSFDGETFHLKAIDVPTEAWVSICEEAVRQGYRFEQPSGLRVVEEGVA